jgi:hypothetical protein
MLSIQRSIRERLAKVFEVIQGGKGEPKGVMEVGGMKVKKRKSLENHKKEIRERFTKIHDQDIKDEERVKIWLEKKGFKIEDWHNLKRSNKPYDIIAQKGNKRWVIEVKGGKTPPIKLANFKKMLTMKNINMVGLALVIERHPYLLSFNRRTYSSENAWKTIKRRKAARKAVKTRERRKA